MSTKICFVALSAYPMLSGKNLGHMIGPDVHTVLLGRELMKHHFEVTFVTYDEGGPPVENIDGIEVIKTYQENPHLNPVFKAFRIWGAMKKAKADIYFYHGGADGVTAPFCRLMRKRIVYHVTSKPYVRRYKGLKRVDSLGSWLDIHLADVLITLNESDRMLLKRNFGKDSLLIKNHFPLTERGMPEKAMPPIVLWVGAMAEAKNPKLLLKLAEEMPEARLQMIGGKSTNRQLYEKVKENSCKIPNLQFLGVIPFNEINEYFSQAAVLVNTAHFESYPPYSFIQAWMNYTPVVTLNSSTSADEIMYRYKLGFHSKTFQQLKQDVKMLLEDEQLRQQMGENARRYVEENHDITKIVKQHIEVLNQLVKFR